MKLPTIVIPVLRSGHRGGRVNSSHLVRPTPVHQKSHMRQCPTLSGDDRPLIAHSIGGDVCMDRQRGFYHKCHRCVFRGQAIDFTLPSTNARAELLEAGDQRAATIAAHANGVAHTNGVANTNGVAPESGAAAADASQGT